MKVIGVVQVRMGSSRLPQKAMKPILGRPLIAHLLDRIKRCRLIDHLILATTDLPQDQVLLDLAKSYEVEAFSGHAENVLDRYYHAALPHKPDHVVRMTGDCPLIDPEVSDAIIARHLEKKPDYTSNIVKRSFPRGLDTEVMKFSALEKAWKGARTEREKQHVTPYITLRPDIFSLEHVVAEDSRFDPSLRLCVDTEEDLKLVCRIYEALYREKKIFLIDDIIQLIRAQPELRQINAHVKQRETEIIVRAAMDQDCDFYYEVASDPLTRQSAFHSDAIPYENHVEWFKGKLQDPLAKMFVVTVQNQSVGQIRFDRVGEDRVEVDVGVHPNWRGRGIAARALQAMSSEMIHSGFAKQAVAWVKKENHASQKAFQKAGYQQKNEETGKSNAVCFVYAEGERKESV